MNKYKCVNIDNLIKDLQNHKCDYWINSDNNKHYGHHVTRVLSLVLKHIETSSGGLISDDPEKIISKIRKILDLDKNKNAELQGKHNVIKINKQQEQPIFKDGIHKAITRGIFNSIRKMGLCKNVHHNEYAHPVNTYSGDAHYEARQYYGCNRNDTPLKDACMLYDILGNGKKEIVCPFAKKIIELGLRFWKMRKELETL